MTQALENKIALVTGASRGIGRAVAIELARQGAHVICTARTVGGLEDTDDEIRQAGGSATLVPFSLKDGDGIDRLGGQIFERWGRLDALVANAGILGALTPVAHIEPKLFAELIEVNLTANYRLIRSLDPLLRQSDAGRAVFVTSGAAHKATPFWGGYAVTKAALEMLALTYAAESGGGKVRVNLFNPGATRTVMRKKAMPGEDQATLNTPDDIAPQIAALLAPSFTENGQIVSYQG